ncbi:unnamed protein product [[Candida] boidinii]|uniref:Unnamed protein product n=1 Tax=Candida boidinii TaxID=5477 RepID=A0ACB5TY13_CANBO|nr:unnamed protein product [[Candida] boidinii]
MNHFRFVLLSLSLFVSTCLAGVTSTIETNYGCLAPTNSFTQGFDVKIYEYPKLEEYYKSSTYYYTKYRTLDISASATAVSGAPSFSHTDYSVSKTSLWKVSFNPNQFLAEFTAYLVAPATGLYEFYFDSVDDGCMAFLGNGAFACCDSDDISGDSENQQILFATWTSTTGASGDSALIYLQEGVSYPMRIVYINMNRVGSFSFTMKQNGKNLVKHAQFRTLQQFMTISHPAQLKYHKNKLLFQHH